MRNWNTQPKIPPHNPAIGFYFTYEELKLSNVPQVGFSPTCFYFTYEELKLPKAWLFRATREAFLLYLWGIETPWPCSWSAHVWPGFYFTYEELKPFSFWKVVGQGSRVFTLPMRNWNTIPRALAFFAWPGFYFTYEELKLFSGLYNLIRIVCFYFTYEELKHAGGVNEPQRPNQFLLYLWGIETR